MEKILGLIIIVFIWLFKAAVANEDKEKSDEAEKTEKPKRSALRRVEHRPADKQRPSPTEIRDFHQQRRADEWESSEKRHAAERAGSQKRWADARKKQSDAALVHGVHIDSCEGRLESLKVLYDAGILDREEYAQRVSRVKAQHVRSRA